MSKKIICGLSVPEIDKAIKEVEKYKSDLIHKCQLFAEKLAEEGVYIARVNIANEGAIYSSELLSSIHAEYQGSSSKGATWIICTDCPYAKYIEFGFGIVGSQNPHPDTSIIGWKYDINEHGQSGWFYEKDGKWFWSKGQASKPFMWETAIELRKRVDSIAREVFA